MALTLAVKLALLLKYKLECQLEWSSFLGKVHYKHTESNYVIRWNPRKKRWFFDWRGLHTDNIASACVKDSAKSPELIQKPW